MFQNVSPQVNFPELEKQILDRWYKNGIVKKYLHRNDSAKERFSFIDGPITANNPMGVHHAWGRTFKDLWQRYHTMKGEAGRYQNGFDCQGLWVEVEVEKELGIRSKKDIENLVPGDPKASVAKFVELCKARVHKFAAIQTEQSKRLGYFMDWENSYYTMSDENNYMIWHFLKTCHEHGWIYKGRDSVPWCPRCETAISQHEMLTEDYKELTHETVFVKFEIRNSKFEIKAEHIYLIVWTTTPWTVPANVAVGINTKFTYGLWENETGDEAIIFIEKDEQGNMPTRSIKGKDVSVSDYILAECPSYRKVMAISGRDLLGLSYDAPFDHLPRVQEAKKENPKTFHTVVDGSDIVVATEGTGLLHVAPGAGQEDFQLGKKEKLPVISVIADNADYLDKMDEFSGKNAKKHPEIIIDYLKAKDSGKYLLKPMRYTHRYPACWRCKTELVWKVADEWYIAMDIPSRNTKYEIRNTKKKGKTLRERMIGVAKNIRWMPEFGLDRELDWLKNMHDWLISKPNRYWGLALPIYECAACKWFTVIGSKEELKKHAAIGWETFEGHTPHKPWIDAVKIRCEKCSAVVDRLPDVGNVWLDAGIVPYSTLRYTSDKAYWKRWFPADFITESFPGQFKNWFYSLIAMSTVLEDTPPFQTVLGYGTLLGEDGRPMHKSWGNSIEFNEGAEKIGADVMRWMYVRHDPASNMLFGYKKADETRRTFHLILWNVYNFFTTYANAASWKPSATHVASTHILDVWILSRLQSVIETVTNCLDDYDVFHASASIDAFVSDLSLWYVRRSRDRKDTHCFQTMYTVLTTLSLLLTPFTPFLAEEIYQNLTGAESVHLADWPKKEKELQKKELEASMQQVRQIVELLHAKRKESGIKVRQPLQKAVIKGKEITLSDELLQLIQDEVNLKEVIIEKSTGELSVVLDTTISDTLKKEGEARELIRTIQLKRKELHYTPTDEIVVTLPLWPKEFEEYIKTHTGARTLTQGEQLSVAKV